jgi:hypothetical protein
MADYLNRLDFIIIDELGYLPVAQAGGQPLLHLFGGLLRAHFDHRHHEPRLGRKGRNPGQRRAGQALASTGR